MTKSQPGDREIANILDEITNLLEIKDTNPFRLGSYRDAAERIRGAEKSIAVISLEEGQCALRSLPDMGEGIARIIHEIAKTGRSIMLERLQGEIPPGGLFSQVPGIGEELAVRIAKQLDVSSLEELEQAAHHGRLEEFEGLGEQKVDNIRVSQAGMLSTAAQKSGQQAGKERQ